MGKCRDTWLWTSALALTALAGASPLAAQTAAPTNTQTATPAPAPTDNSLIGPPQLRDFTLKGTVTRAAEPATATPDPTTTPSATATRPPAAATPRPAPTGPTAPSFGRAAPLAGPDRDSSPDKVTVTLAPPSPAEPTTITPSFTDAAPAYVSPTPSADGGSWWPWLLALLGVGAGIAWFALRQRRAGYARTRTAYAGVSDLVAERVPQPAATPAAHGPGAQRPLPATRAPAPKPAAPPVRGGIVASGLKPKLGFELRPIRAETDASRGAALLFDVIVINNGSAPARDVLIESQLINAGPNQDEEIGRFFRAPAGQGERLPLIPPMGRVSIKSRLSIAGDKMRPIAIDGRELFVPLVAFNALYRWSGGEEQDSASFLVGRGEGADGKMAPFRLDQGVKSWTGLGARPHSMGLQR